MTPSKYQLMWLFIDQGSFIPLKLQICQLLYNTNNTSINKISIAMNTLETYAIFVIYNIV